MPCRPAVLSNSKRDLSGAAPTKPDLPDHTSMPASYVSQDSSSSGARYQRVTTYSVMKLWFSVLERGGREAQRDETGRVGVKRQCASGRQGASRRG